MGKGPDDVGFTDPDEVEALAAAQNPGADTRAAEVDPWPLSSLTLAELDDPPPPREWLLMQAEETGSLPLYPRGKVGLLSAAGGTGKSMALCALALAVATGRPWFGNGGYGVPRPGRVALLLAEEDREEVRRRLYYAARLMGLSSGRQDDAVRRLWIGALVGQPVELVQRDDRNNVVEHERAGQLRERLAELTARAEDIARSLNKADDGEGWALVIVDPLSRFGGVDTETDNGAATRAVQALEALTKLRGNPAVMVAVHERKGSATDTGAGQEAVRGSSAIVDAGRWVARLIPVEVERGERWTSKTGNQGVLFRLVKTNYTAHMSGERLLMLDRGHAGALRVATSAEVEDLAAAREEEKKRNGRSGSKGGRRVQGEEL